LSDEEREKTLKLLAALKDSISAHDEQFEARSRKATMDDKGSVPWRLYKGSTTTAPRVVVPTTCTDSSAVYLAYLLVSQIDDLDIQIVETDCAISMGLTPELNAMLDGMILAVRKGKEITSGSFGGRSKAVDNGFAAAVAQCCIYFCQEKDKNRGFLLDIIPDDLVGTKEQKKVLTELFGKIKTLYKKDDNEYFVDTLIWLFNKWAQQHANSIGRSVMRCQKISWESIKKKAIPHKIISRKVKGKTVSHTAFSVPKNIGVSPLCSAEERTVLKSLAHIGYHDRLREEERKWKALDSGEQHDTFNTVVSTMNEHHRAYCEAAARVCGRQYKRRKYFEKLTGESLPSSKKKADPKVLNKHLADMSKKVFSDPALRAKLPLQTSCMALLVNTILEDIVEQQFKEQVDLNLYFNNDKAKQLKESYGRAFTAFRALKVEKPQDVERYVTTNQYGLLDDDDESIHNYGSLADPGDVYDPGDTQY
jgi:hypothetical protein